MRGFMLFVAGLTIGLMVQAVSAQNMTPNRGLIGLNHVGGRGSEPQRGD